MIRASTFTWENINTLTAYTALIISWYIDAGTAVFRASLPVGKQYKTDLTWCCVLSADIVTLSAAGRKCQTNTLRPYAVYVRNRHSNRSTIRPETMDRLGRRMSGRALACGCWQGAGGEISTNVYRRYISQRTFAAPTPNQRASDWMKRTMV